MSNILWTTWYIIAVIVLSGECRWLETRNFQKHPVPENVLLWEGGKLPAHKAKICVTFVHQQGVQWKDMPCHVYPNAWNLPIHAPCVFICWACYQHWLVPWTNLGNLPYVTILMIALHWSTTAGCGELSSGWVSALPKLNELIFFMGVRQDIVSAPHRLGIFFHMRTRSHQDLSC